MCYKMIKTFKRLAREGYGPWHVPSTLTLQQHQNRFHVAKSFEKDAGFPLFSLTSTLVRSHIFTVRPARQERLVPGCPNRKSTRLNSSHVSTSYAVFCLKKKKLNAE